MLANSPQQSERNSRDACLTGLQAGGGRLFAITEGVDFDEHTFSAAFLFTALCVAQALEQRLREKDEQVDRLAAQLEDSNSRLRYREQEARRFVKQQFSDWCSRTTAYIGYMI